MYDDNGRLMNPSLLDYRKLTAADLPNIETIIVEVPAPAVRWARGASASRRSCRPWRRWPTRSRTRPASGSPCLPLTPERVALAL